MLNKIIKSLLGKKSHTRYSSSDFKRRKYSNRHHPSKYGHQHYKRKGKSSSFFSSYSS